MRLPSFASLLAVLLGASAGAAAQDSGSKARGLDLALRVCANCHAVAAGETLSPVAAAPSFEDVADNPGMTGMALAAFLRTPHSTMPDLILSRDEIDDVTAHILSLKD